MSNKKLAICMLSATLLLQATGVVYAKQQEMKTLTLEKAIESAQTASTSLRRHERNTELAGENADMAKLTGGWYAYDPAKVNYQYMQKQEEVIKDNIELSVTKLFDDILYAEEQLEMVKVNIELQEKQIEKHKIEYEKGLQSQLNLEGMNLKLAQTKQQQEKLAQDIEYMYRELCELIGTTKEKYQLERPALTFEPYEEVKNVESFAKGKAEQHIEIWKASEDLRVAVDTPIFTQDYMLYITKKAEREDKKDNLKMTEEQLVAGIRDTYTQVKTLEKEYYMKEEDLKLKEKEQRINQVYLERGMMSQLDYQLSKLQYETAKMEMKQILSKHAYLKFKLDHPHVIRGNSTM